MREALLRIRARIGDDPGWRIVVRTDSLGVINWLHALVEAHRRISTSIRASIRWSTRGCSSSTCAGTAAIPGNERVDSLAVEETHADHRRGTAGGAAR